MSAGPDDRDEGFLARWSRRKREIVESGTEPVTPLPEAAALPTARAEQADAAPEPDMVEPPSLDLIDKDFDLAHWLKQNVPESWKLAALRRAWLADPTIRNFENPARDYALDWNTPGGAPGYGPLTESDDVEAMVRAIFGEKPDAERAVPDAAAGVGDSVKHQLSSKDESGDFDAAVQQEPDRPELAESTQNPELASVRLSAADNPAKSPNASLAALQESSASKAQPVRIRKRGGGAIPV
ncbi:DUF3306 domain-containing protein [Bosea sp. BK604]|uniref:DUF3306 domain-containing protein n=1 Tax=Bosea sp. BK604 TaxID=2512180 RepID=UPI00104B9F18|nr:DUF3306 domain-containing protein [Bosea sp. BK604]TCR61437.1 uncharacterized protein DUF3306 [Bosea sp. BK604]